MKNILIILACFSLFACSKVEEVASVRIVGSNTELHDFKELNDGSSLFFTKKKVNFLNNSTVSNLSLKTINLDSVEIENLSGTAESLVLQTNAGLVSYKNGTLKKLKNFDFSVCDQIAVVDTFVVVSQTSGGCNSLGNNTASVFSLGKSNDLIYLSQINFDAILKIEVIKNKLIMQLQNGDLKVFEITKEGSLSQLSELSGIGVEDFKIIRSKNKLMILAKNKYLQYKINADYTFQKLNEI
ncbi:hypothetical protein [Lacihabitans lacunae]|uniref:Auto-transporter adhesin head GIN domain-containing protein n=1 Tax=Lacihabitans lacunae TaxID=1028214 RepID=A0ABV7YS72_9BACT